MQVTPHQLFLEKRKRHQRRDQAEKPAAIAKIPRFEIDERLRGLPFGQRQFGEQI